jgi:hypothetical protein
MNTRRFLLTSSISPARAPALVAGLGLLAGLAGCSSSEVLVAHSVDLVPATEVIPEAQLLDVAVNVFDPGVPEGEIDKDVLEELIRQGTFVNIRRAEARYMAVELRNTLQKSGQWGSVWVTPGDTDAADLNVSAKILDSDGDQVRLKVKAVDATGGVWVDRDYEMETAAGAFNRQRYPDLDPYQDVFNEIANDLASARAGLSARQARQVRDVAEMRYASDLAPEAFDDYVAADGHGKYKLNKLPAVNDPMFDRTMRVRQREYLFLDTLNQHYDQFHQEATDSYDGWRQYAREEAIAVKELTRSSRWRTGLGIATVVASMVYGANSDGRSFSDRVVRDALMYVGMDVIRSGAVHRQERRLHAQTLEELSTSFDDDVKPLVVDIRGTQHRLTGTADLQYQEWRSLLRQLFIQETGFVPDDIDVYDEPTEPEPAELQPVQVPSTATAEPASAGSEAQQSPSNAAREPGTGS